MNENDQQIQANSYLVMRVAMMAGGWNKEACEIIGNYLWMLPISLSWRIKSIVEKYLSDKKES